MEKDEEKMNIEPRTFEPLKKIKGMDYETPFVFCFYFAGDDPNRGRG
jgi:hypothetical protein